MQLVSALTAITRRTFIMMGRYVFNTVSALISIYMVFCLAFFGMKAFAAASPSRALDGTLEGTIVGFFIWALAVFGYSGLSWELINEAQMGTLEQLYLSPNGFKWLCAFQVVVDFLTNVAVAVVFLFAMMATTGRWLNLDVVSIAPLLIVTLLGAYGVGFALGGLALVFKRIQSFFQVVQFAFVGCLVIPWRIPWARFLPLSMGNSLIYRVMAEHKRLWELPAADLLTALAVGAAYLAVGLAIFSTSERAAKTRGLLGHY